ncbi:Phosphatidylinositol transfer protein SEC14 and related proteins protein [Dioscorea alata]|uniref:Phosphatidylinositol transfer protein SEC14 and related proteins protein n=1 Tax=Dioscorea alata TaxID=55571 RepID=A0ACB7WBB7_DIOAL|nr:Phosphatidylinositol transfer protein SEC14 and related proteins protein [Dioscorea alata]
MAEETQVKPAEEVVVAAEVNKEVEEPVKVTEVESALGKEKEEEKKEEEAPKTVADEEAAGDAVAAAIEQSESFKEESNIVADLQDPEKKALDELKQLVQAALAANEFVPPPPPPPPPAAAPAEEPAKTEEPEKPEEPAKTEEPEKLEEPAKAEEPKPEEAKPEEAVKPEEPEKPEEAVKTEDQLPVDPVQKEEPAAPVAEEKAIVVEEEKTVEAIEETIVPPRAPTDEVAPVSDVVPEAAAPAAAEDTPAPPPEDVFIWGVPLLGDEKSDTILLKFLRARDFKTKDALTMIKNTVIWRKTSEIEALLEEDLGFPEMEKVVFMHGQDKEGHPVCYNVYGEFQDKDLYSKAFGDEEKRQKFLRWRIQFLEKGIRQHLDFSPGGVCTMVQVTDLKNSPGPGKRELRQATNQALALLQDNYPEFVAKQVFINVPWWYLAFNRMISPFLTQRTKSKFVFAGPSKSAETLFKYIAPEQVPVQYGGLSKENDPDFTTADAVTEVIIKPSTKHPIEIPVTESCNLVWELRVLGWDVTYGAEFVPGAEDGYTVIVQKARKLIATDEPVVKNSFKTGDTGKIVLTIDNTTSKKKKLLYRYKIKTSTESI